MINKEILLDKANKIIEKNNKEKLLYNTCIKANICPKCGENLIREDYELYDKPKKFLFIKIKGHDWDYRVFCSKNKSHYEDKEDYDN